MSKILWDPLEIPFMVYWEKKWWDFTTRKLPGIVVQYNPGDSKPPKNQHVVPQALPSC